MDVATKPGPEDDIKIEKETLAARQVMAEADFRVVDVTLVILTLLAVLYTLYFARSILVPFVFAFVFALLLAPVADFMSNRLRLPRILTAAVLILALFAMIVGVFYAISLPAAGWIAKAPESLPILARKLSFLHHPIDVAQHGMAQVEGAVRRAAGGAAAGSPAAAHQQAASSSNASPLTSVGLSFLSGTGAFLGSLLTMTIVLFFLLADGDTLLRRFVEILPNFSQKRQCVSIANQIETNVSGYLATITLMNALVGIANGLSLWAFGMPNPLLFGTLAFLLNYVPILGALTGIVIFFVVGLFSFDNVVWALGPPAVYFLIHVLEGETVTPMLLARRFTLNPLLVIVALMFWDWLWGIPGALLAVPLLAVVKIFCDHVEALTPLGHILGAERVRRVRG